MWLSSVLVLIAGCTPEASPRLVTAAERQCSGSYDVDGDGVPDACDDCPDAYDPFQGAVWAPPSKRVIADQAFGARSVFAADLDGDGDPDVLTTGWGNDDCYYGYAGCAGDDVAWYENLGDGTFGPSQQIAQTTWGASVYAADLDGDGDADVLSASTYDDAVAWYENLGGAFGAPQEIPAAGSYPSAVFATDLDGDGDADVLTAFLGADAAVAWNENLGGGVFGAPQTLQLTGGAGSVFATDLDGDGDPDVLAASGLDDVVSWHENLGGGSFGPRNTLPTLACCAAFASASDLDGDGDADVLATSMDAALYSSDYDSTVTWYENLGGGFGAPQLITSDADFATTVYAADLDGDGDRDVVSAAVPLAWYPNLGGAFGAQQILTAQGDFASAAYPTDLDGDGLTDVVYATHYDGEVAWFANDATLGLAPDAPRVVTSDANSPASVSTADLDGDGDADVVVGSLGAVGWMENLGGRFGGHEVIAGPLGSHARSIHVTDFDGDGDPDVLWAEFDADQVQWSENLGAGLFGAPQLIADLVDGAGPVSAADLDGDGDADVLFTSFWDDEVAWRENLGGGAFGPKQVITASAVGLAAVSAADLDSDGDPDVLAAYGNESVWFANLGGGVFGTEQVVMSAHAALSRAGDVEAADLDGDGDLDLISTDLASGVFWYANLGGGVFGAEQTVTLLGGAQSLVATDLDGDGDVDLAWRALYLEWIENLGGGVFAAPEFVSELSGGTSSVSAADLDDDGDPDLVALGVSYAWERGRVVWYENHASERQLDSDQDGVCDLSEICDPTDADYSDVDADGVCDPLDVCPGSDDHAFDLDGDGSCALAVEGLPPDCDDHDPTAHPGAPEQCDGVDNACAGSVPKDEADVDLDGFRGCAGDCDDADASAFPGAAEACDGQDDDCDGATDEDLPTVSWYEDADADGYGSALSAGSEGCAPPGGGAWVADATDCDDANPAAHPDAVETCDGIDENCVEGTGDEPCAGPLPPEAGCGCSGSGPGRALAPGWVGVLTLLRLRGRSSPSGARNAQVRRDDEWPDGAGPPAAAAGEGDPPSEPTVRC